MHAYNPLLDEVSHGAKQTKVWEEYKAERTARETENVDDEAAGSDSRCAHREKRKHMESITQAFGRRTLTAESTELIKVLAHAKVMTLWSSRAMAE